MKKLFATEARITQGFGVNGDYYKQFNLPGHEGLDIVPTGQDWTIFSPFAGEIARAYESEVYGKTVMIFNREYGLSTRLAHLAEIFVKPGQLIKSGHSVGMMGNTGKSHGAHLHINMVPMLKWGERVYADNEYRGRIDPLGILWMLEYAL